MILTQLKHRTWFFIAFSMILGLNASANELADKYINAYSPIAESEMMRVGIPASIKLAQGLLESNWGRSTLATKANNHFGIKCGSRWYGREMYRKDDDYTSTGELMQSCFRAYDSAFESYMAHSDFLLRKRYAGLFDLSTLDYRSWANGLKNAGYATDPKYPSKLIQIIEKYELYRYDKEMNLSFVKEEEVASNTNLPPIEISQYNKPTNDAPEKVVIARRGNKNRHKEEITTVASEPILETRVKKNKSKKYHNVASNETMKEIAAAYGLKLKKLYAYNRIPEGASVLPGEEIKLNGYIHWGRKPKYIMPNAYLNDRRDAQEELLFEGEFDSKD